MILRHRAEELRHTEDRVEELRHTEDLAGAVRPRRTEEKATHGS